MADELIHLDPALDLASVHPNYRGLRHRDLLSALRVDLDEDVPMEVVAAISVLLGNGTVRGSARVEGLLGREALVPRPQVVLEVLERREDTPSLAEQVEQARRQPSLPLVRLHKTRRD